MELKIVKKQIPNFSEQMAEEIEQKFRQKLEKYLTHFEEDMEVAEIGVDWLDKKNLYILNFNMVLPGDGHIYADAQKKSFTDALTDLREKVERKIKTHLGKLNS
jgi:ribosome-associated translation inhibitor RaiA